MCTVWCGTGETRLRSLRRAKTGRISRWRKWSGAERESEGVIVPRRRRISGRREGPLTLVTPVSGGKREGMAGTAAQLPRRTSSGQGATNSNAGYAWRPSGPRGGASTRCMTGSAGVTSWRRRGSGCRRNRGAAGVDRRDPGDGRAVRRRSVCSRSFARRRSGRASIGRSRCGGGTSRSQTAAAAAGHPDGAGSGGAAGGEARPGADLRGGLPGRARTAFGRGGVRRRRWR